VSKIRVTPYAAHTRFRVLPDRSLLSQVKSKYKTSNHFILAVSNMQPRKNLSRLMQAFARARQQHGIPHKLVLVGQQLWLTENDLAQARILGDSVVLTGYVPDADLPLLYNAADVFAYPSLYEGFGLPVLEAMACGTPVITSNLSSLPEVAGDAALLVNPYSVEEMSDALVQVLTNGALKTSLRERGLARAGTFSWERTARQTVEVYHLAGRTLRAPPAGSARTKSGFGNDVNGIV
jgi:glycosyltransferase involved in cell wall biosynthesis